MSFLQLILFDKTFHSQEQNFDFCFCTKKLQRVVEELETWGWERQRRAAPRMKTEDLAVGAGPMP